MVKAGGTILLEIPDGAKELYGKMDWAITNKFSLAFIEDGDELYANGRFVLNPLGELLNSKMPIQIEGQP